MASKLIPFKEVAGKTGSPPQGLSENALAGWGLTSLTQSLQVVDECSPDSDSLSCHL